MSKPLVVSDSHDTSSLLSRWQHQHQHQHQQHQHQHKHTCGAIENIDKKKTKTSIGGSSSASALQIVQQKKNQVSPQVARRPPNPEKTPCKWTQNESSYSSIETLERHIPVDNIDHKTKRIVYMPCQSKRLSPSCSCRGVSLPAMIDTTTISLRYHYDTSPPGGNHQHL